MDSDDNTSIGSRTTLNGLKRWTTEENLSSGRKKLFFLIIFLENLNKIVVNFINNWAISSVQAALLKQVISWRISVTKKNVDQKDFTFKLLWWRRQVDDIFRLFWKIFHWRQ